ncbi:MAG: hypothetical protein IPM82_29430 [Saprospiraceae bacterium]|nr:hypothetical protein [Saprospiraceae bacterium]
MQAIQAQGLVNEKHQLLVQLPDETKAGKYEVIVLLLKSDKLAKKHHNITFSNHQLPVEGMTFSRSEIYGEDGR